MEGYLYFCLTPFYHKLPHFTRPITRPITRPFFMSTVKLIIRKSKLNKEGKAPIYLQYCYKEKTALLSTGEKIEPKLWNSDLAKPRKSKQHPELDTLNDSLQNEKSKLEEIIRKAKVLGEEPTLEFVKGAYSGTKPLPKKKKKIRFWEVYDRFVQDASTTKQKSTLSVYKTSRKHLEAFETWWKKKLSFEGMDRRFYEDYTRFLFEEKSMFNNSVGKYVKTLKTFLSYALDQNISVNRDYHKFKVLTEEIEIIHLTKEELDQLVELDLSANPKLDRVRDVFCFGCFTGLRYSDLKGLRPENFDEDWLMVRIQKTGDTLKIPLIPQAKKILTKYMTEEGYRLPVISNQKMNVYLKELAEFAGIDQAVSISRVQGANRTRKLVPKYELITMHTARKTFVTVSFQRDIPPEIVMKITGHKNLKVFHRYLEIVDETKMKAMLRGWG